MLDPRAANCSRSQAASEPSHRQFAAAIFLQSSCRSIRRHACLRVVPSIGRGAGTPHELRSEQRSCRCDAYHSRSTRYGGRIRESGAVKIWRRKLPVPTSSRSATSFNVGSGGPTIGTHEDIHQLTAAEGDEEWPRTGPCTTRLWKN
jgi:hypothetical protein